MRYSLNWFDDSIGYNKTISAANSGDKPSYLHYDIRGYFMIFRLLTYRLFDFYYGHNKL